MKAVPLISVLTVAKPVFDLHVFRETRAGQVSACVPHSLWWCGCAALNNSDDSMDSASDDAQDDDDPSYTPGRPIDTDKGESVLDVLLG